MGKGGASKCSGGEQRSIRARHACTHITEETITPSATATAPADHRLLLKLWMRCVAAAAATEASSAAWRAHATLQHSRMGKQCKGKQGGGMMCLLTQCRAAPCGIAAGAPHQWTLRVALHVNWLPNCSQRAPGERPTARLSARHAMR